MTDEAQQPDPEPADDLPALAPQAPTPTPAVGPRRHSRAFRQELLSRLPHLTIESWAAAESLDVYQEMQGLIELDADAFLQPLQPIAEKRND